MKNSLWENLLTGFSSIFDIDPDEPRKYVYPAIKSDEEAIRSDWEAVGKDMEFVMNKSRCDGFTG